MDKVKILLRAANRSPHKCLSEQMGFQFNSTSYMLLRVGDTTALHDVVLVPKRQREKDGLGGPISDRNDRLVAIADVLRCKKDGSHRALRAYFASLGYSVRPIM